MTELSILTDTTSWREGAEQRRLAAYRRAGFAAPAAEASVARWLERSAGATVAEIRAEGRPVGAVAVVADGDEGRIEELWIDPAHAGAGHGEAARGWAERWSAERGATSCGIQLFAPEPLFDAYPVRGQNRVKFIGTPAALPDGVTYRPMTETEYPAWRRAEDEAYVFDIVRAGGLTREQAQEKSDADFARLLPQGRRTPGHAFMVLEAEERTIGTGWLHHGFLPGVTYGYSLFIEEHERGNGYGRAAMAIGEQAAVAAGDTALMFNVFGGNEVAMGLYTSAGFGVLFEYRSVELGG
ncbi:GNAT family N-acetyltransferase [Kitasatospora sp. NPDC048365]|uniref:GNAT family N-acetyltransferase n=1 Tax=Kitasatospora sp. NPDC048365 TaxID=3364050 RepID=UPI003714F37C